MSVKLQSEYYLEFLSLKVAQARLSIHLSKCHIVGNHMSRLKSHLLTHTKAYIIATSSTTVAHKVSFDSLRHMFSCFIYVHECQ